MKKIGYVAPLLMISVMLWAGYGFVDHYAYHPGDVDDSINWISIEEAYELMQKEQRKIVVDVYTDWCGWCKVMDRQTYGNQSVASYINENFYAVKLDAEQREAIQLGDKSFDYVARGRRGYHEYAAYLLGGKMSYPSTVFLDENMKNLGVVPGFIKPGQFSQLLSYVHEEAYKEQSFQQYSSGQAQ